MTDVRDLLEQLRPPLHPDPAAAVRERVRRTRRHRRTASALLSVVAASALVGVAPRVLDEVRGAESVELAAPGSDGTELGRMPTPPRFAEVLANHGRFSPVPAEIDVLARYRSSSGADYVLAGHSDGTTYCTTQLTGAALVDGAATCGPLDGVAPDPVLMSVASTGVGGSTTMAAAGSAPTGTRAVHIVSSPTVVVDAFASAPRWRDRVFFYAPVPAARERVTAIAFDSGGRELGRGTFDPACVADGDCPG